MAVCLWKASDAAFTGMFFVRIPVCQSVGIRQLVGRPLLKYKYFMSEWGRKNQNSGQSFYISLARSKINVLK